MISLNDNIVLLLSGEKESFYDLGEKMFGNAYAKDLIPSFTCELLHLIASALCALTPSVERGVTLPKLMDSSSTIIGYKQLEVLQITNSSTQPVYLYVLQSKN